MILYWNPVFFNRQFLSEYIFISQSMNRQTSWRLFCPSFYSEFWEIGTNDNRRFFRSWFPAWLMITTTKQEPSVNRTLISKYFLSIFIVLSVIWESNTVYFSLQHWTLWYLDTDVAWFYCLSRWYSGLKKPSATVGDKNPQKVNVLPK